MRPLIMSLVPRITVRARRIWTMTVLQLMWNKTRCEPPPCRLSALICEAWQENWHLWFFQLQPFYTKYFYFQQLRSFWTVEREVLSQPVPSFLTETCKNPGVEFRLIWYIVKKKKSTGELNNTQSPGKPQKMTRVENRRIISLVNKTPSHHPNKSRRFDKVV